MQHNRSDKRGVQKRGEDYSIAHQKEFVGPLPAPEDLKLYNDLIPNGADRFMIMAEKEQAYRHSINKQSLKSEFISKALGQFTGILALLIISYFFYIYLSKGVTDMALKYIALGIISLVSLFVTGKLIQYKLK